MNSAPTIHTGNATTTWYCDPKRPVIEPDACKAHDWKPRTIHALEGSRDVWQCSKCKAIDARMSLPFDEAQKVYDLLNAAIAIMRGRILGVYNCWPFPPVENAPVMAPHLHEFITYDVASGLYFCRCGKASGQV